MTPTRPPRLAEWLAAVSLAQDDADSVLGDLAEDYAAICAHRGAGDARRWYWRQTAVSLVPNLQRKTRAAMESVLQDLGYGWRMIRQRPIVTTVALISLLIGIALPAVVFSLLNAVLFRPLPVANPDELAVVHEVRRTGINHNLSYPDFVDYRTRQRSFTDLVAYAGIGLAIRAGSESRVVAGELVSGGFFSMLGIPIRAGRPIAEADDRPGGESVAVVNENLWRELTGRDIADAFVSRIITVNAHDFAVIGVVDESFRGMQVGREARIWLPIHSRRILDGPGAPDVTTRRGSSWLTLIGRLRPYVTREAAAIDLNQVEAVVATTVKRPQPKIFRLAPGRQGDSMLPQTASSPLTLLLTAGLLVLLVAAANVASLLLARATERRREMAVRAALGARRTRLARLVVTETTILGVLGAIFALLGARWMATLLVPYLVRFGETVELDVSADWRVIAFVLLLAVVVTVLASIAPAAGALKALTAVALAEGGRSASEAPMANRFRRALVVAQFALSLALVVVSLLSARTVHNLRTLPTGFDIDHIALFSIDPEAALYDAARSRMYVDAVVERVSTLPGVRAAGFARIVPLGFGGARRGVIVPGYQPGQDEDMGLNYNAVSPTYFAAMGIRLLHGRVFDHADTPTSAPVVVINETMAARFWRSGEALGRRVRFDEQGPDVEVVGIVQDVKYRMLREDPAPSFYIPHLQSGGRSGVLHVRTWGDPGGALTAIRQALSEVDANVPITTVRTLRDQAALNVSDERLAMVIAVTLAGAALLLAAVGLYGSMSHAIGQRTRELGVRVALGATGGDIGRLILKQAMTLCVLGTLLGSMLALLLGRAIEHRLFQVTARDPATLAVAVAILCGVTVIACWVPARRAMRVDPANALRGAGPR